MVCGRCLICGAKSADFDSCEHNLCTGLPCRRRHTFLSPVYLVRHTGRCRALGALPRINAFVRHALGLSGTVRCSGIDNLTLDMKPTIARVNIIDHFSKRRACPQALQVLIQDIGVAVRSIFSQLLVGVAPNRKQVIVGAALIIRSAQNHACRGRSESVSGPKVSWLN